MRGETEGQDYEMGPK